MSGPFGSTAWMYNAGSDFYDFPITNSLRFEDGDSAYLSFTPSANGNRTTWTWSAWVKRGNISLDMPLWGTQASGSDIGYIRIDEPNTMNINNKDSDSTGVEGDTVSVLRDASAWYNIVVAFAGDESAQADRVKVYINSIRDTYVPRGSKSAGIGYANTAVAHALGAVGQQLDQFFDGYMAEVNFIDGTALTPSSFGEYKNDIWIPKDTAGLTFGDQGYRLQFKQVGTGTASSSTIGADTSGEDNHWTSTNLVASDVVPDSPTNNFATLNPLDTQNTPTISEGNLKLVQSSSYGIASGTIAIASGKYYWEVACPSVSGSGENESFGISKIPAKALGSTYLGINTNSYALMFDNAGPDIYFQYNNSATDSGVNASDGDIFMLALDSDTGKLWFGRNGTWFDSGNPANGSNEKYTATVGSDGVYYPVVSNLSNDAVVFNFGQDSSFAGNETAQGNADGNGIGDFYYAPPSGFLALCTANLPDPVATIDPNKGGSVQDYFNTVLWTGNDTSGRAITGVGFQPDFVWIKNRAATYYHSLSDTVRGITRSLSSNATDAEVNFSNISAVGSDGFTISDAELVNKNAQAIVAWNWKAGTAFSNDASSTGVGSIDSAGSVNSDLGFSIISYTGTGSAGTIAHGLGVVPEWIIVKRRDSASNGNWFTYVSTLGNQKSMFLDLTDAVGGDAAGPWNSATPTTSVFSIGTSTGTNASSSTYIAYCFASVDGYLKLGSYTANANADGPFVYTGFAPAFLMIKNTSRAEDWAIVDNRRGVNPTKTEYLAPNNTAAEIDSVVRASFVSNGFKIRAPSSYTFNHTSGDTYIYMAFAEQPFKYSNAQ